MGSIYLTKNLGVFLQYPHPPLPPFPLSKKKEKGKRKKKKEKQHTKAIIKTFEFSINQLSSNLSTMTHLFFWSVSCTAPKYAPSMLGTKYALWWAPGRNDS